jgi:EAL domain-containing protein (putative c-di-GMP-specific phosphodiesterase class I)/GGDEF domain-containing protein
MSELHDELIKILEGEKLTPYFQPIVSIPQKKIIGYEALIRGPSGSPLYTPFVLFTTADQFNLSSKLEYLSREISLKHYASLNCNEKLFINVSPSVLLHPNFKNTITHHFQEQFGLSPCSVVIEITEHQATDNYLLMRDVVGHCRDMGFQIALDDLGAGYSGLRLWAELRPDYVKIDKHFIEDLHSDPVKINFVRSIQSIANSLRCDVIAEGIETEAEFKAVEKLGIRYAQGFYFAKPTAIPVKKIDVSLMATETIPHGVSAHYALTAAHIIRTVAPLSAESPIAEVLGWWQSHPEQAVLPLVDEGKAAAIVFRDQFFAKLFSSRYGLELYGKKPVKLFVDKQPLCFEQNTPLEVVSQQLTSTVGYDKAFIITYYGEYKGIGTVWDLLEEITRQQIQNAKHANPLTLLPGSVPVNDYINRLLADRQAFAFAYFDLDNFKPFNDVYGYSAGDGIIKVVADTLQQHIGKDCGLVGHIGGDDFIVVFICDDWLQCCQAVLTGFHNQVCGYYNDEDVHAGGIYSVDRLGTPCFFPLISLSVGIVPPEESAVCQSHVDIADLAANAKKQAKQLSGDSYFISGQNTVGAV